MISGDIEPDVGLVLEATASALARLVQPDLSTLPADQVERARARMFGPGGLRPEFLDTLRGEVSQDSDGRIALQDADPATFPYLSKEFGACYLKLTGPGVDQLVIIGNTTPLALFVS